MFSAVLVCATCLAAEPGAAPNLGFQSKKNDLTIYEHTKAKIGRGELTPMSAWHSGAKRMVSPLSDSNI